MLPPFPFCLITERIIMRRLPSRTWREKVMLGWADNWDYAGRGPHRCRRLPGPNDSRQADEACKDSTGLSACLFLPRTGFLKASASRCFRRQQTAYADLRLKDHRQRPRKISYLLNSTGNPWKLKSRRRKIIVDRCHGGQTGFQEGL